LRAARDVKRVTIRARADATRVTNCDCDDAFARGAR
jgi:hypothetical protein